jgi:NTE family protein
MKEVGGIRLKGIISSLNIELAFREAGKVKGISKITDVKMPIVIPATDLITGKSIIFTNNSEKTGEDYISNIELSKAVRASATFPGVYSPFEYKGYQFVDGGVLNNLPVEEVKNTGVDKTIAIKFAPAPKKKSNTMYNIIMQSVDLMTEKTVEKEIELSDCVIDIDLYGIKTFNINKLDFCYEEGYKQTIANIDKIKGCVF